MSDTATYDIPITLAEEVIAESVTATVIEALEREWARHPTRHERIRVLLNLGIHDPDALRQAWGGEP